MQAPLPESTIEQSQLRLAIEPIVAWRVWDYILGPAPRLLSTNFKVTWKPFDRIEARCFAKGPFKVIHRDTEAAPKRKCTCGIYAVNSYELATTWKGNPARRVLGTVTLWGITYRHTHGYRAQFAYPKSLMRTGETAHAVAELADTYGLQVFDDIEVAA